ncbi:type II restriction/modification system DNA methylase subunit YeeA [Clostridium beijerinckii]|uniref:BREX-1 system adenine-specific DNA-methyltransferase PglX n=1 Tax=Clostridium beijerinckii TaxID=1520 RepID=UPI001493FD88|nr:BREX-1 system adenine-specific DNA-methyltransferase PglX [Clostridium beijerinckii]NOW84934.1 type II restriction/modification system DNA methylase subunit YeeA [Clostridium beijerinckii]
MDKNKIKSFAIWARRNLISAVKDRARYIGIFIDEEDGEYKELKAERVQGGFKLEGVDGIFKLSYQDRDDLVKKIKMYEDKKKGFEQVMEEVAYTWFNRFMGLRYMEVNDYLPSGIRVLSSEVEGKIEPDVLTRVSEVIDELNLNAEYIYELLDSGKTEDREEVYKHILVRQCNELGKIIPQMFEKISDYTELLLPDNLLEEGSVIRKMVEDIEEDDWKEEVEIIGWMYQYYISEKHDQVVGINNGIINKNDIPAATQLFTPKWVVKYMVDNSLGKYWVENYDNSNLSDKLEFFMDKNMFRKENNKMKLVNPENIKVLDNAMGSGHILVYSFDVLWEIYKEFGYSEREIPRKILSNNIYGLDIDERATQLAAFALIMKARHYNRRLFREIEKEELILNISEIKESNNINKEVVEYFLLQNENLREDVQYLINIFKNAKEYGSILNLKHIDIYAIKERLRCIEESFEDNLIDMENKKIIINMFKPIVKQFEIMSNKYEIVVTNPPYMGNYDKDLKKYILENYSDYKKDLFSVFIKKNFDYTVENGYLAFMTPMVWMFIKTFENLRKFIIKNKSISSLIELEYSGYEEATVPICTFVLRNADFNEEGTYIKLSDFKGAKNQPIKVKEAIENPKSNYRFICKRDNLKCIEGMPLAYWASDKIRLVFENSSPLNKLAEPKQGLATGDNNRFLRLWHEVNFEKIGINKTREKFLSDCDKWVPCNKGGEFRRWYGNNYFVVDWENDGKEMKSFKGSVIRNERYYFNDGLTWSTLTSSLLSMRYSEKGFIFETKGSVLFPLDNKNMWYLLALLNSNIVNSLIKMISPTIDYHEGPLGKLPIALRLNETIDRISQENMNIARRDWDSYEISWNFKHHPLLNLSNENNESKLSLIFDIWKNNCEITFKTLKNNEEELNKIFIDIYGLHEEITSEVDAKNITIRKANPESDIRSFISYAVGCILGRYSVDAEGLIYAGGEFKEKWNLEEQKVRNTEKDEDGNVISDLWVDATFVPDMDNVIPITEDEYFEDDVVSRFIEFVRTVYSSETLEENLDFIADSIGRKASETARQAIRRYFIKDFYKDHLKVYQKRPIYWMFESGKNDGFKALIYMHRYNEQTVAKVRTDYLHTLQRKYEAEIQRQQLIVDSEEYTAKDRTAAKKKIDRISKQIEECREYDQVVAHLANEKISIDLDDGVKVNYEKFQGVKVINSKGKEVKMDLLAKI